jgi:hypothetical protein
MMSVSSRILSAFLVLGFLSLGACGNSLSPASSSTILPDDPGQEPASTPTSDDNSSSSVTPPSSVVTPPASPGSAEDQVLALYDYVDPGHVVPDVPLKKALLYYDANKSHLKNSSVLSVIDFSQFSGKKRFFIIDMKSGSVWSIRVAHGKGSDPTHDGYAHSFSNVSGSNATSLGFYMTAETYYGDNGYSLRLDGLSSTNSNARSRAIVVHGASYVEEANVVQGRSWGCPAVALENRDKVINLIKGGSLIYAWSSSLP